jgi:hypothetical protein
MVNKKKTTKKVSAKKTSSQKKTTSKKKTTKKLVVEDKIDEEITAAAEPAEDLQPSGVSLKQNSSHDENEELWVKEARKSANFLLVKLSKQLRSRLQQTAESEGVGVTDLVEELLAESVVLRAWEIMQRKGAMRGESGFSGNRVQGGSNNNYRSQQNQRNNNNQRGSRNNHQNRNKQQGNNQRYYNNR